MRKILILLSAVIFVTGCAKKQDGKSPAKADAGNDSRQVVAQEVIQVTQYTYVLVQEDDKEIWIVGPKTDIIKGQTVTYSQAMEMKNFKSKELNRTFDSVLFVNSFSDEPASNAMDTPQRPVVTDENVKVEKTANGITIAQLYSDPNAYANQVVKIRGKVVKINAGIMDRNWLHIQDGSKSGDDFDLTVTSQEMVQKNEIVTVSGKIALNKDFGYGYSYKILMEDAKVIDRTASDHGI